MELTARPHACPCKKSAARNLSKDLETQDSPHTEQEPGCSVHDCHLGKRAQILSTWRQPQLDKQLEQRTASLSCQHIDPKAYHRNQSLDHNCLRSRCAIFMKLGHIARDRDSDQARMNYYVCLNSCSSLSNEGQWSKNLLNASTTAISLRQRQDRNNSISTEPGDSSGRRGSSRIFILL